MNKLFTRIATFVTGTALAVGVGIALAHDDVRVAKATDATITPVSGCTAITFVSESAYKLGNSGGTFSITVPAGATSLSIHAVAWKDASGSTYSITKSSGSEGATISPSLINLTANSSVTGNSPSLGGANPEDYKFDFTLTSIGTATTFQFASGSSSEKRSIVWGASYEAAQAELSEIKSIDGTLNAYVDDASWDLSGLIVMGRTTLSTADEDITSLVDLSTTDVPGSVVGPKVVSVTVTPKDTSLASLAKVIDVNGTVNEAPVGPYDTVEYTQTGGNTSYTTAYDVTSSHNTWASTGNMSIGNFIRVGGKSASSNTTRTIKTNSSYGVLVDKVTVNHLGINGKATSTYTFVSLVLDVSKQSNFSTIYDTQSYTTAISGSGSIDFEPTGDTWDENSYYRLTLTFRNTSTADSAGLDISSIEVYKGGAPVAPTGVTVAPTEAEIQLGKTVQLVPTVEPDNATDKSVTYEVTSANPAGCISVDEDGLVHGNALGSGVVTVTDAASHTATSSITVVEGPAIIPSVTHIDGNTGDSPVHVTFQALYGASVEPQDISITEGYNVISLSNKTTSDFDVGFLAGGTATIKITDHTDSSVYATITATVIQSQVNSVTLNKHFLVLNLNAEETLIADVQKQGSVSGDVTWTSSVPTVASVDSNGKVKGLAEGTAIITATAGDKSDTCTVEVGNKYVYNFGETTAAGANEGALTSINTKYSVTTGGSFSDEANLYTHKDNAGYAIRMAASGKVGSFSYTLSDNSQYIEKVVIRAKSYGSDTGVKLNVTPTGGSEISHDVTSSYSDLTYTFSGSEDINGFSVASLSGKRLYVAKIDVYYGTVVPVASLNVDTTTAVKTTYYQGQSLVTTGIVVNGLDSGDNVVKENIPHSSLTFSPTVLNTIGEHIEITVSYTNKDSSVAQGTFEVEVIEDTIQSIAVSGNYKDKYLKGDTELDKTGLVVTATYASGDTDPVDLADLTFEGFDASTIGVKTINVSLTSDSSIHTQFTISVREAVRLDFFQEATKKAYYVGETLDTSGLVVEIVYSNGTDEDSEPLLSGYTVALRSGESMDTAGTKHVDITYPGLPVLTYEITVSEAPVEPVLQSIEITHQPNKTTYYVGEDYSNYTAGLVVVAHFYDGDDQVVTNNCTIGSFSTQEAGIRHISVTYSYKGVTKGTSFDLTVLEVGLQSIVIKTAASKTSFKVGDTFSASGLVVTATFSNSTTQDVQASSLNFSGYDMNTAGTQTVTVSYTVDGITKTTTYSITVSNSPAPTPTPTPGGNTSGGLSGGAIAGIVIGSVVVAAGIGVGIFFLLKKKKVK